jgi:hypothetical protein
VSCSNEICQVSFQMRDLRDIVTHIARSLPMKSYFGSGYSRCRLSSLVYDLAAPIVSLTPRRCSVLYRPMALGRRWWPRGGIPEYQGQARSLKRLSFQVEWIGIGHVPVRVKFQKESAKNGEKFLLLALTTHHHDSYSPSDPGRMVP